MSGKTKQALTDAQLSKLSHPTNVNVLIYLMERPAPLLEIAQATNLVPLEVGYRLRQLTEAGLVRSVTREAGTGRGGGEKYYEAAIKDLEYVVQPSDDVNRNANQVRLISMLLRKDLLYHASHPEQAGPVHVRMIGIRCTPDRFEQFLERMKEFEKEFDSTDDADEAQWYYMTVAMYAKAGHERSDGSDVEDSVG